MSHANFPTASMPVVSTSRLPPADLQAEQQLLGALLIDNDALKSISVPLAQEHFAHSVHGRIYQEITRAIADGAIADVASLCAVLAPATPEDPEPSCVLDEVGGGAYLAQLEQSVVARGTVPELARAIRNAWLCRQLVDLGEELQSLGEGLVDCAFKADPNRDAARQAEDVACEAADLVEASAAQLRRLAGRARAA